MNICYFPPLVLELKSISLLDIFAPFFRAPFLNILCIHHSAHGLQKLAPRGDVGHDLSGVADGKALHRQQGVLLLLRGAAEVLDA